MLAHLILIWLALQLPVGMAVGLIFRGRRRRELNLFCAEVLANVEGEQRAATAYALSLAKINVGAHG